jgi:hypothetical protein
MPTIETESNALRSASRETEKPQQENCELHLGTFR